MHGLEARERRRRWSPTEEIGWSRTQEIRWYPSQEIGWVRSEEILHTASETMDDPLQLRAKDPANAVRFARAAPPPDVERIYRRITAKDQADSGEVRLLLLAYVAYAM